MKLDDITVVVLTYNEIDNISRCLTSLREFTKLAVLDSGSDDGTRELVSQWDRVMWWERKFDNHRDQSNEGIRRAETDWLLFFDADYVMTEKLKEEIKNLELKEGTVAYYVGFGYCVDGYKLRASLYPPRAVLFDKRYCRYVQKGHTQWLEHEGAVGRLHEKLLHDDRKSMLRWVQSQVKYAQLECESMSGGEMKKRLRRWGVMPWVVFIYLMVVKGLWLDGRYGMRYVVERVVAEWILFYHWLLRKGKVS
jgi:glycosyltransferase involved in cell wall biosynthesis